MQLRSLIYLLPLLAAACSSDSTEEEGVNIENMVLNEASDAEWTTGSEEGRIAKEDDPIPQEKIIAETPDAPLKQNPVGSSR